MKFKNLIILIMSFFISISSVMAETASMDFVIEMPEYLQIQTVTSAVLIANITDKTGNLYSPLSSRFRVISNNPEQKTLYLRANALTENGVEESMFEMGGRVYVAFANIANKPKGSALANCKIGANPKDSPGIVAYPVTSITGVESRYQHGGGKYEVYVKNGVTNITVNIGSNVLKNSFASNDPKGFYQATLLLTESEI